jgi:hypothetical protein
MLSGKAWAAIEEICPNRDSAVRVVGFSGGTPATPEWRFNLLGKADVVQEVDRTRQPDSYLAGVDSISPA